MSYSATIEINFIDDRYAKLVYASLSPDMNFKYETLAASITLDGNRVICRIDSGDISKLKGVLNSLLRLLKVISDLSAV